MLESRWFCPHKNVKDMRSERATPEKSTNVTERGDYVPRLCVPICWELENERKWCQGDGFHRILETGLDRELQVEATHGPQASQGQVVMDTHMSTCPPVHLSTCDRIPIANYRVRLFLIPSGHLGW